MTFAQVIGQQAVKERLKQLAASDRVPHALLFTGPEGCGKLPLALAFAQRLLCKQPTAEGDACGTCPACRMVQHQAHPDQHFVFPVVKGTASSSTTVVSDQYLPQWREQLAETPYFTHQTWVQRMGAGNQQSQISVAEAEGLMASLAIMSNQGGYRVVLVWLPELMHTATANKLLKLLEEPPQRTVFLMVTEDAGRLLETIVARTQRVHCTPLTEHDITQALVQQAHIDEEQARVVAHAAGGNFMRAMAGITVDVATAQALDLFILLMRMCYQRRVKDMHEWAEQMAQQGREAQKAFLDYCQHLVRENFMYNFRLPQLTYMNAAETQFATRFARFINERNVIDITQLLADARRDIEQNVNARMVFFDLALQLTALLLK